MSKALLGVERDDDLLDFPVFVAVSFVAFAGVLRAVVRRKDPLETWARMLSVAGRY